MTARKDPGQGAAPLAPWLRALSLTVGLALLVAAGLGDSGTTMPLVVIGTATLGFGTLYRLFPRGVHLAFGTATGLALYASLFEVLGRAQFPAAPEWSRAVAFLLPVLAFMGMAWHRRDELEGTAEQQVARQLEMLPHTGRWLLYTALVGLVCFVLPANRLPAPAQAALLLASLGAIAAIVAFFVRDVVRLLVDVALIVEEIRARVRHLVVPAATFLLIYVLLVVAFGAAYRIADGLSIQPLFRGAEGELRLSFSDALHFSIATLSTVGYGDIRPEDDGVRVLASLEVVAGQLLLLFGVAEILRAGRGRRERAHLDQPGGGGHSRGKDD